MTLHCKRIAVLYSSQRKTKTQYKVEESNGMARHQHRNRETQLNPMTTASTKNHSLIKLHHHSLTQTNCRIDPTHDLSILPSRHHLSTVPLPSHLSNRPKSQKCPLFQGPPIYPIKTARPITLKESPAPPPTNQRSDPVSSNPTAQPSPAAVAVHRFQEPPFRTHHIEHGPELNSQSSQSRPAHSPSRPRSLPRSQRHGVEEPYT